MKHRTSGKPASRCNILVSVDDSAQGDLDAIAAELRAKGMKVVDVMPLGGVITGEAGEADLARLRKVRGISALEIDTTFTAA
jgi:hypothetical protein